MREHADGGGDGGEKVEGDFARVSDEGVGDSELVQSGAATEKGEELVGSVVEGEVETGDVGAYSSGESAREDGVGRGTAIVGGVEGEGGEGGLDEGGEEEWRDTIRLLEAEVGE